MGAIVVTQSFSVPNEPITLTIPRAATTAKVMLDPKAHASERRRSRLREKRLR